MQTRFIVACLLGLATAATAAEPSAPLVVREQAGVARAAAPVTGGVPVGPFGVKQAGELGLFDASGKRVPCQIVPIVTAPDGTLTWVLVDFQTDLSANEVAKFALRRAGGGGPAARRQVRVDQTDEAITVDTGMLKAVLSKKSFDLFDQVWIDRNGDGRFGDDERMLRRDEKSPASLVLVDAVTGQDGVPKREKPRLGAPFTTRQGEVAKVALEDSGPLRATVRIDGAHGDGGGATYLKYTARLTFRAGSPAVKLLYSIRNTNREANTAAKIRRAGLTLNLAVGPDGPQAEQHGVTHYLVGADVPHLSRLDVAPEAPPKSSQRHWAVALEQRGPERAILSVTDRNTFHRGTPFDEIGYRVLMDQPSGRTRFADCGLACQGWLALADDRGGCLVWLRNFTENPLKRLRADGNGRIDLDLIPQYDGDAQMFYAGGGYWIPSVEDETRVNRMWGRVKEGPVRPDRQEELATEFLPRENYHWRSESDEPRDCLIEYVRTGRYDLLKRARSFANVARDMGVFRCDGRPLGNRPAVKIATDKQEEGLCGTGWGSTKMCDCHNYGAGLVDMWLFTGDRSYLEAAVDNVENHVGRSLRGEDRGSSRIADGALRLFEVTGEPRLRDWLKDAAVFTAPVPADKPAGRYVGSWMHSIVIFARYRSLLLNGEAMEPKLREATRSNIIAWAREAALAADALPAAAKTKSEYGLCAIYTIMAGYELTGDRKLLEAAGKLWDKEHQLGPDTVDARMQDWGPSSGANFYWVSLLFEAYAHPKDERATP